MKRTYLQRNTIEDQRKLNTGEKSRYSSGSGEFHPSEILLKEQHFDIKSTLHFKYFVRMKRTSFPCIVVLIVCLTACGTLDLRDMFIDDTSVKVRFAQSETWNESTGFPEIKIPDDGYSIVVSGDVHIGGTVNFDKFLNESKALNVPAIVLDGDITNANETDYDTLQQHLPDKKDLNYFAIPGNHDLFYQGWENFYRLFGSATYYFTIKSSVAGDLFICLDTGSGTLGKQQLSWLKDVLMNTRPFYRNCIVFSHCDIFEARLTNDANPLDEEILVLADLFAKYEVNMVITGHDHKRNVIKLGNTTYVTLDALLDGNANASYLKLTIKNRDLDYQFVDI